MILDSVSGHSLRSSRSSSHGC